MIGIAELIAIHTAHTFVAELASKQEQIVDAAFRMVHVVRVITVLVEVCRSSQITVLVVETVIDEIAVLIVQSRQPELRGVE